MAILLSKKISLKKISLPKKHAVSKVAKTFFWFSFGALLGTFFFVSFLFLFYQKTHTNLIYSGVMINGTDFGGKTQQEIKAYFAKKNVNLQKTKIILTSDQATASISARQISFGYDENLLAQQAFSIGRSDNTLSNMSIIFQAYLSAIRLPSAYHYAENKLDGLLIPLKQKIEVKPVDALFNFQDGRVVAFQLSSDGKTLDTITLKKEILSRLTAAALNDKPQLITINIPITDVKPAIASDKAKSMGLKELIAEGNSLFQHSIENRIFNISLAASRLNGILIPPGQTFSFDKAVGDISAFTGYKQAYVIENGKTVLGDGGGVCQVSTTLFRAALNAGLPIVERNAHAYRVGYYEQNSPPGIDAAVYSPSVDLKFKNDTHNYILIQSFVDLDQQSLTFDIYGTKDNRQTVINTPVILSESPAPDTLYQDDPTLPKGELKQVDFAAAGANVYFTRKVTKDGKSYLSDKFVSNYRPWQAIYLRGTKE